MNIVFLSLVEIESIEERGIYPDLLRKLRDEGHDVTVIASVERRTGLSTAFQQKEGVSLLRVKTLNIRKTNLIEKGIGTIAFEYQFLAAAKKYLAHKKIDLVICTTPPITYTRIIQFFKKRDGAKTYLLLKDIFPQNAVDIALMSQKSFFYRYFRCKEKELYALSDTIGCMSPANVAYILRHNPEIPAAKVEVNPNSMQLSQHYLSKSEKEQVRRQHQLPLDKTIFIYGGNLGKPQGISFLLEVIAHQAVNPQAYFLIVGTGTEYPKLLQWFTTHAPANARLIPYLEKNAYDNLVQSCDVGLILLDHRFTIPNFPSRLLSYLEYRLPVVCATDPHTDIGTIAHNAGFGFSVPHGQVPAMHQAINTLVTQTHLLQSMGNKGFAYLEKHYLVEHSYQKLMAACG